MSYHYLRVVELANEEQLLREKLKIENRLRKQQEREKQSRHAENVKYSRILQPVTKSIEQLENVERIVPKEENSIDLNDETEVLRRPEIE